MATLKEDVLGVIGLDLFSLRENLLTTIPSVSPTQLIDQAIAGAVEAMENRFELRAKAVCESDGSDHWCTGITQEYWDIVNDDGGEPFDLRKAFNENSSGS